ncbi:putative CCR4-associated factor 1 homolog 8 [Cucurbita pepo subsp. pepo]|uniref:putative CCR4-associated factor 1 homolog 8 n=1 Tax=Cucurbita pepo subsp. pepo TaxID=3664 RepID=UPI000C9D2905|nr:putative CCR4-associated factor 1 homolog 8 [Cucurbita pepo subsp. pepo]
MAKMIREVAIVEGQWKRDVWSHNLSEEIELIKQCLSEFPIVAIDTEFPGFLRWTPKGVSDEEFYECLQFNVNRLSILQLGLTLTNDNGKIGMTWEFNFQDFDKISNMEGVYSLDSFLKNKGFNFNILRSYGIAPQEFGKQFNPILRSGKIQRWITFHGLYDIAYLMKFTYIRCMPTSMSMFAISAAHILGTVTDLKHMARYSNNLLNGNLGLKRLAKLLQVNRTGTAHFAGSDSLLTAAVYAKMKIIMKVEPKKHEGFLYGLPYPIQGYRRPIVIVDPSKLTDGRISTD